MANKFSPFALFLALSITLNISALPEQESLVANQQKPQANADKNAQATGGKKDVDNPLPKERGFLDHRGTKLPLTKGTRYDSNDSQATETFRAPKCKRL